MRTGKDVIRLFYLKNLTFTEIGGFGRQDNDPLKMPRH